MTLPSNTIQLRINADTAFDAHKTTADRLYRKIHRVLERQGDFTAYVVSRGLSEAGAHTYATAYADAVRETLAWLDGGEPSEALAALLAYHEEA